jgi:hypothetical protein
MSAEWLGEPQAHAVRCRGRACEAREVALDMPARAEEVGDQHHLPRAPLGARPNGFRDGRARQRQVGNADRDAAEPPRQRPRNLRELFVGGGLPAAVVHEDQCAFVALAPHQ